MQLPATPVAALCAAHSPLVLSGAGLSAESGLATFRGSTAALWERHRPEDLATPAAFARDPALVWRWYTARRQAAALAAPNPGHAAIAELATLRPGTTIVTQNVDGLLQQAGAADVLEFHGNLFVDRCSQESVSLQPDDVDRSAAVPRCRRCGALVRPGVVWFGEAIPPPVLDAAFAAAERADGVLVVGTSASVAPANALAGVAQRTGAWVTEINPAATAMSAAADHVLRGNAGDILPALIAAVREADGA